MDIRTAPGLETYEEYLEKAKAMVSPRSPEDLARVKKFIDEYDFSYVEDVLKKHVKDFGSCFDQEDVDRLMPQFRTFMFLKYKFPDFNLSPNTEMDTIWHQFYLHGKEYEQFCMDVYGEMVYHTPFHWKPDGTVMG